MASLSMGIARLALGLFVLAAGGARASERLAPGAAPPDTPLAQAVEEASPAMLVDDGSADAPSPLLIKAEVLLDRARFSPGAIDGRPSASERAAVAAFQARAGLPASGQIDAATWSVLTKDGAPALKTYALSRRDVAGPFAPDFGEDLVRLAALRQGPVYSSPIEAVAARFHMSQALLMALNPSADFSRPGTTVTVAAAGARPFARGEVRRIEVSVARRQVTVFDGRGQVIAVYPASIGSADHPSPTGQRMVTRVVYHPPFSYNPGRLNWGPRKHLTIRPGPKGPVGEVWIAINAPDLGIHGAPDPAGVGQAASHGCVRLTNWDALALAKGVRRGVPVIFLGDANPSPQRLADNRGPGGFERIARSGPRLF